MIISITGKPCSGKGAVSKIFCEKYNFKYLSASTVFRDACIKLGIDVADFNSDERVKDVDKQIDSHTIEIGKKQLDENIMFDSRLAWHFIPKSFKVFLDVNWQTAGKRLYTANRDDEKVESVAEGVKELKKRWDAENKRYMELYGVNNLNKNNYNLYIKTDKLSPEEIAEKIYAEYKKFMQNA